MGDQRDAAIDSIVAQKTAALDELALLDAGARRVVDAVTRIASQSAIAQGVAEPPAALTALAGEAQHLVDQVEVLVQKIGRLDQWGRS